MNILFIILLVGLHISPLMFFFTDMWVAQGIMAQTLILICLCALFIQKPLRYPKRNLAIFFLTLWIGLQVGFICFQAQVKGRMDITHFFPFFNYLCILIFYITVVCYITEDWLKKTFVFIKYCVLGELILCILQFLGVSQFFVLLQPGHFNQYSLVVGLLGNGTHLSGFIATFTCLFLTGKREDNLILVLMFLVLCLTGTTITEPALNGFAVAIITILFYSFKTNKKLFFSTIFFVISCVVLMFFLMNGKTFSQFFSFNGRLDLWQYYWNLYTNNNLEVTGYGIGTMNEIFRKTPFPTAKHLHNELFHWLFEGGFILVTLIVYFVIDFLRVKTYSVETLKCKTMFLGFLVSSMFNYPGHLWMPSVYAAFSYGALMALERGKNANTK